MRPYPAGMTIVGRVEAAGRGDLTRVLAAAVLNAAAELELGQVALPQAVVLEWGGSPGLLAMSRALTARSSSATSGVNQPAHR